MKKLFASVYPYVSVGLLAIVDQMGANGVISHGVALGLGAALTALVTRLAAFAQAH